MVRWVAFYSQYGQWSVTVPFDSLSKLETHCRLHLMGEGTKHKELVHIQQVNLPESEADLNMMVSEMVTHNQIFKIEKDE